MKKSDLSERELLVATHLSDIFRFGAAIGWWHDSQNALHRKMASDAMDAAVSIAARDLVYRINEFDKEAAKSENLQTRKIIIKNRQIFGDDAAGEVCTASVAYDIARANGFRCAEHFIERYDCQSLTIDGEGKIILCPTS